MTHLARVLRLTLGLSAIAAPLACAAVAAPDLPAPPLRPFDVLHYDVQLTPDLQSRSVKGRAQIEFRVLAPVSEIELDAGALVIDSVHDGTRALPFAAANGRLRVSWPAPLPARSARTIAIAYHGTPRNGLTFIPEREQIYTVFSTSQWMPAIDAPDERATWRLELTLPAAWSADASGDLIGRKELGGGRAIHEWRQRAPVPSYTLGFAAGRFLAVDDGAARPALRYMGDGFSALELRQVFRDTRNMLDFFESRAGVPYPGKSYTQTLTAQGIGQEMAGLAVMPESYGRGVLADERESWLGAHEAAHQWWGNLVTCRDWRHFWLNEGFATFMVAAHKEHRFGRADYDREISRIRARYERVRDAGRDRPLVFPDWDRPTADDRTIVYQKGAYVLHLLREHLGDETFWQGIRAYTRKHAGQSVATQDFQAAMEKAAGRSLDGFFQQWVHGPLPD